MTHIQLGHFDQTAIEDSYDLLPLDKYTPGEFRFRRMSKVVVDGLTLLNESTFIQQPASVNNYLSDRKRVYEKIEDSVFEHPTFKHMVRTFQLVTGWRESFDIHQIRIVGKKNEWVSPTPEGPHRDGYEFVMPFVHKKVNLVGGVTRIQQSASYNSVIMTADLYQQFILIPDREVLHSAASLWLFDPNKKGYWDTFVFTANKD